MTDGVDPWVSVDLSAVPLEDPQVVRQIIAGLAHHAIAPKRLAIEVTGTAMAHEVGDVKDDMGRIERSGFNWALENFGTAISAITYQRRVACDEIKVDRSFVAGLAHDGRSVTSTLPRRDGHLVGRARSPTASRPWPNATRSSIGGSSGPEGSRSARRSHSRASIDSRRRRILGSSEVARPRITGRST
ncbi:MAG: EAL domain-containing protein [Acidobacteria bacterium]|nr:EAL domain-containing protein [Acidobacteriota bacterium]